MSFGYGYGFNFPKGGNPASGGAGPNFEYTIDTTLNAANDTGHLFTEIAGTYNCTVYWGDGNSDVITVWNQAEVTHVYSVPGIYKIKVVGPCTGWKPGQHTYANTLISVNNWGNDFKFTQIWHMFRDCVNLTTIDALDTPDLTAVTQMNHWFRNCGLFATAPKLNDWDVSGVTQMRNTFRNCDVFNVDLSAWDVSGVTLMNDMFNNCAAFNPDLSAWDISSLTDAQNMLLSSAFSTTNYDLLLPAWDANPHNNGVLFHAGSAQYSAGAPATAHANLITDLWTITDGGPV